MNRRWLWSQISDATRLFSQWTPTGFIGSPETIRKRIATYEAVGVQKLRIMFPDAIQLVSIQREALARPVTPQRVACGTDDEQHECLRRQRLDKAACMEEGC